MITLARALACFMVLGATLVAQSPAPNDAIFRYRGADRDARLVERAKREGRVVLYTSLAPTESQPLAAAFEKKYGVKVELWRALSDQVVRRTITEAQARRHAVDVIETNGPEMEMLAREKLLGAVSFASYCRLADDSGSGTPILVSRSLQLLRRRLQHHEGAALADPCHVRGLRRPEMEGTHRDRSD